MRIRAFKDSDEEAVVALWNEVFPDAPEWNDPATDIQLKLAVQPELLVVVEEGDQVIGTAMAGFDGHRGWVHYVAVAPRYRRRGVGAAIMAHVERELAALGCPKLNLQVRGANRDAVAFYRALGYEVEDRISMARHLAAPDRIR